MTELKSLLYYESSIKIPNKTTDLVNNNILVCWENDFSHTVKEQNLAVHGRVKL